MKKLFISVIVLAVIGYFFIPGLSISFVGNTLVKYVEEFDNSPKLKLELIEIIQTVTAQMKEQGAENYFQSLDESDSKFLAMSMDKIKDNDRGLLEKPLSDSDLRKMIKRANKMLGIKSEEYAIDEERTVDEVDKITKNKYIRFICQRESDTNG